MTFEELQKIVYDAGIVGAGGAGFYSQKIFRQSKTDYSECGRM